MPSPDSEPALVGTKPATQRAAGIRTTERPWQSRIPLLLAAPATVALLFLVLPLVGLVIRAPWPKAGAVLAGAGALQALKLSLITATVSAIIVLIIGVPLAWVLARPGLRGASLLLALITIPGMGHDLPRELWPTFVDAIARNAERAREPAAA